MLLLYAVLIVLFCYWFYAKFIKVLSYWKDRNVPSTESYLFFGGMYKLLMRKESFYDFILRLYSKHESSRLGIYIFLNFLSFYLRTYCNIKYFIFINLQTLFFLHYYFFFVGKHITTHCAINLLIFKRILSHSSLKLVAAFFCKF